MALLITGAAGFVAWNVVEHLLTAGHDVVGLDGIPLPRRTQRDFAVLPGHLSMLDGHSSPARRIGGFQSGAGGDHLPDWLHL